MSPSKRQSASALLAAAAVLGLPVANAAAALQATTPTAKQKTAAAKAKAAAANAAAAKKAAAAKVKAAAATTTAASARRTVSGDTFEMDRWGPVTVSIVVEGNKIIEAIADLPMEKPRSNYINSRVGPYLNAQVVQIQSAKIDLISGATQTCDAYAQSLQSAIDKAGIKLSGTSSTAG